MSASDLNSVPIPTDQHTRPPEEHWERLSQGSSTTYPLRELVTRTWSPTLSLPRHAVQQLSWADTSLPSPSLTLTAVTGKTRAETDESSTDTITPRLP